MNKEQYILFCPKCKSTNTDVLSSIAFAVGIPTQYTCKECNFSSFVFPEATMKEIEELKKE